MATAHRRPRVDPASASAENSEMNRIAILETHVGHLVTTTQETRADLRILSAKIDKVFVLLAGMTIASTLGLATLIAKGFHWL